MDFEVYNFYNLVQRTSKFGRLSSKAPSFKLHPGHPDIQKKFLKKICTKNKNVGSFSKFSPPFASKRIHVHDSPFLLPLNQPSTGFRLHSTFSTCVLVGVSRKKSRLIYAERKRQVGRFRIYQVGLEFASMTDHVATSKICPCFHLFYFYLDLVWSLRIDYVRIFSTPYLCMPFLRTTCCATRRLLVEF